MTRRGGSRGYRRSWRYRPCARATSASAASMSAAALGSSGARARRPRWSCIRTARSPRRTMRRSRTGPERMRLVQRSSASRSGPSSMTPKSARPPRTLNTTAWFGSVAVNSRDRRANVLAGAAAAGPQHQVDDPPALAHDRPAGVLCHAPEATGRRARSPTCTAAPRRRGAIPRGCARARAAPRG